jgi:hypothetical protein
LIADIGVGGLIGVEELRACGAEAAGIEGRAEGREVAVELGGGGDEGAVAVLGVADLGLLIAKKKKVWLR